jgi:hypothetical protein
MHSLLHVSVHLDHPQGAYADTFQSYTFIELSVKYIVTSFAVLWQHVFQAVVCVSIAVQRAAQHSIRCDLVLPLSISSILTFP